MPFNEPLKWPMTEMTKEMESRTGERLAEVYRSVVIPVIGEQLVAFQLQSK